MRYINKKKVYCSFVVIVLFIIFRSHMDKRNYEHIQRNDILANVLENISVNFTSTAIVECEYRDIIYDETFLSPSLADEDLVLIHQIREGGEYAPIECKPKFSTAIIVPYKDRAEELRGFLVYMHKFLHRQRIHYKIFVVEQVDLQPFNRAKLLNIGVKAAMKAGFPCLVLHNLELLPLKPANLYTCTKHPRHMSSNIHINSFFFPLNLIGGVIAIASEQYKLINGMSNEYYNTQEEDDDFYCRIEENSLKMSRFEPDISRYLMQSYIQRKDNLNKQKTQKKGITKDGLNTLQYTEVATVLHPLFTHIMVDL